MVPVWLLCLGITAVVAQPVVFNTKLTGVYLNGSSVVVTSFSPDINTICSLDTEWTLSKPIAMVSRWTYSNQLILVMNGPKAKAATLLVIDLPGGDEHSRITNNDVSWAAKCNIAATFDLPFPVASLHLNSDSGDQLVLRSTDGWIWSLSRAVKGPPKLRQIVNVGSTTNATSLLASFNPNNQKLTLVKTTSPQRQFTVDIAAGTLLSNSSLDCGGYHLSGLYLGFYYHGLYAWAASMPAGYLTVVAIDDERCSPVITTGMQTSTFVSGASDGMNCVTAMASDALYVVDVANGRPDDLHLPVDSPYDPKDFVNLLYQGC